MTSERPLLSIGIPTLDRPEMLQRAVDSALAQTVPVEIIVADQGGSEMTAAVMSRYADHPHVRHVVTKGRVSCLWENWKAAADACETPYFAILQDDDTLSRIYASRVTKAFAAFPQALHWQARCYCTTDASRAAWWAGNGPWVPLRMQDMMPELWPGGILIASMFVGSWALSPGVAFRCGPEFRAAMEGMPAHCDLFAERLILAAMGAQGPFVADPVVAAYWVHHGKNESYAQNADGSMPAQRKLLCEGIDSIMDRFPEWRQHFFSWLRMRSPHEVVAWTNGWKMADSRHSDDCLRIMAESIRDRVEVVAGPPGTGDDGCAVIYEDSEAA